MLQAKNLFLKNVSEDVEFLFNLKIDSVIMEKIRGDLAAYAGKGNGAYRAGAASGA